MTKKNVRSITGVNTFKRFDIDYFFDVYDFKVLIVYPMSNAVRVLLEIQTEGINEKRIVHLTIDGVRHDELSTHIMRGGYDVELDNIIDIYDVNDIYNRIYIKAKGLRLNDEHGMFGVGVDEQGQSLYEQSYFVYNPNRDN